MGKFVVRSTEKGSRFNLVAGNGQVVATSQTYKSLKSCLGGIESVKRNAPEAAIEDQTKESWTEEKCPKFQVYLDKAGEFRFRLIATNGQNIAAGEGYTRRESCLGGIESVKKNAPEAEVVQEEA